MENKKDLWTIYGAKKSQKGDRVNVSLIRGENENKEFGTISVKLGETSAKTKAVIKDGFVWLRVAFLEEKKNEVPKSEDTPF